MIGAPLIIESPNWLPDMFASNDVYETDESRMLVAVEAARRNVDERTGGPFAAAIFESDSGRLVSVGVNRVVPLNNAVLHGEVMAIMLAQQSVASHTLAGRTSYELHSSCEPCAMCVGAIQWSGVARVVWAAAREDAQAIGFDEGPVFPETYAYLETRGMTFVRGLLRDEGCAVLRKYGESGGLVYGV